MDNKVIYTRRDTNEEYDDTYMHTLQSYYDSSLKKEASAIGKELGLSENDLKDGLALYGDMSADEAKSRKKTNKKNKKKRRKWVIGDNCRAMYFEDLITYEAVIEKIKGDLATVRFVGYGNKQKIHLDHLLSSNGANAIEKQIEDAEYDNTVDELDHEYDETQLNSAQVTMNWLVGDYCSVYNKGKDKYEDAVIQMISEEDGVAVVTTIGFEEPLSVQLNQIEEIEDSNFKQKTQQGSISTSRKKFPDKSKKENKSHARTQIHEQKGRSTILPNSSSTIPREAHNLNITAIPPPMPPPSTDLLLNPDNEEEALACMLSSSYLSGYYAGYYACLKKNRLNRSGNYLEIN